MSGAGRGQYAQEPQLLLFRKRLKARMVELKISADDLAIQTGVTRQVVWFWLGGVRIPSAVSVIRLARVLEMPADLLLGCSYEDFTNRIRTFSAASPKPRPQGAHFSEKDSYNAHQG